MLQPERVLIFAEYLKDGRLHRRRRYFDGEPLAFLRAEHEFILLVVAHAATETRAGRAALEFNALRFSLTAVLPERGRGGEKQKGEAATDERGFTQIRIQLLGFRHVGFAPVSVSVPGAVATGSGCPVRRLT